MNRFRVVAMMVVVGAGTVWGAMPDTFLYEGYYARNGTPFTGWANVQVRLYSNQYTDVWMYEASSNVYISGGYYSILMDTSRGYTGGISRMIASGEVYAEALINGWSHSGRTLLLPVPFALRAAGLVAGSIKGDMLAAGIVQRHHLAMGAVGAAQIEPESVSGWHIQEGSIPVGDLDTATLDARYLLRTGDTCAGALTNRAGFWGNAIGLTNFSPEALHVATSFVRRTGGSIDGRLWVRGPVIVQTPQGAGTNPVLTRLLFMNYAADWRTYMWAWNLGTYVPYNAVNSSAVELWEYPPDGTPAASIPRLRFLPADLETKVPAEVVVGPQGNMGLGCWPTNGARLQVDGTVQASSFVGDGVGLTRLSPEVLNTATSFIRRAGDTVHGTLRVEADLIVLGAAQLTYVPPQGGLSMGIFTNR